MKHIITSLLLSFIPVLVFSQKVDESTARKVAQNVLMMDYPELKHQKIEKTIPVGLDNDTLYFIFAYPDDGYVIVSAESSAPPVLGHCKKGKYEPENMPPGLLYLLDKYKYSISSLRKEEIKPTKEIEQQWDSFLNDDFVNLKFYSLGTSLMTESTFWGQVDDDPNLPGTFNQFCPDGRPAGCTAVAMAQILRYWQCQTIPTGTVSYDGGWNAFVGNYLGGFANFGATIYNWVDMDPDHADDDNALLIYHAGVSCETYYGEDASYAPPGRARDGFVNNWGMSSSADVKWRISHLNNWQDMLKDEIDLERPILYSAVAATTGGDGGGHSWVIHGYRNIIGTFRCSWGWY